MTENHVAALIVAYYLSKHDKGGCRNLGFAGPTQAFRIAGEHLGVKPDSLKNMRDEFDVVHDNERLGWRNREMYPTRRRLITMIGELPELSLRSLVQQILQLPVEEVPGLDAVTSVLAGIEDRRSTARKFAPRSITGKAAEEHFLELHRNGNVPVFGKIADCRELGCGYDFAIETDEGQYYFEIKGVTAEHSSISFTDKEWNVANRERDKFFLVVVEGLPGEPNAVFIRDPARLFAPCPRLVTVTTMSWQLNGWRLPKSQDKFAGQEE